MKLSVVQENLNKALTHTSRIVGTRTNLPVLGNILLSTEDSRLKVSATNLEMAITYTIGAKVESTGSLSVPAKLMAEIIANLPNDKLQLVSTDSNLLIKAAHFDAQLNGMAADEFPTIPEVKAIESIAINKAELADGLSQVVFAASPDESRPVLAGVIFIVNDNTLTLVATDSYRLAECKIDLKSSKSTMMIVPARTINELIRLLSEGVDGEVEIKFSKTEAVFEIGDISIVSRLIDGKFPDYKQIIPQSTKTEVTVERAELLKIVKVASIFARENANTIKLEFRDGSINIASSASSVGQNNSDIEVKMTGEPGEISLNARYLIDVLGILKSEQISVGINDKLEPCVIYPIEKNKKDLSAVHIIMPLRS